MSDYVSNRITQAIEWVRQPHGIEQGGSLELIARELADEVERLQAEIAGLRQDLWGCGCGWKPADN